MPVHIWLVPVCHVLDAIFLAKFSGLTILIKRIKRVLNNGRMNICDLEKTLQIFYFKVTDTNAPNFTCTAKKNKIFQYKRGMALSLFCFAEI